jgi:hypothetical protein
MGCFVTILERYVHRLPASDDLVWLPHEVDFCFVLAWFQLRYQVIVYDFCRFRFQLFLMGCVGLSLLRGTWFSYRPPFSGWLLRRFVARSLVLCLS